MENPILPIALAALGAVFFISQAQAMTCPPPLIPHQRAAAHLAERYGEVPVSRGRSTRGHITEVFASPGGNWTVVLTDPRGCSIVADSGEGWEPAPAREPTDEEASL